jgi:hypothetical protein
MNTRRPPAIARPTSRRANRRGDDIRKGAPLIVIAALLLAGLIGAYGFVASNRVDLDAETGCPTSGPSAITAILFDRTDPINAKQKLYLENKLDGFQERTQKFEEVDTYSLEDHREGLSLCRILYSLRKRSISTREISATKIFSRRTRHADFTPT